MKALRLLFRGGRLFAVTVCWYGLLELGWIVCWMLPRVAERRLRWRRFIKRRWCAAVCRAMAVQIDVAGTPPSKSSLLVSNHLSYLDIPVLGSLYDTIFVSKAEVAGWPGIGHLATRAGTLYVDRARKRALPEVNEAIRTALERGDGVIVFPEGTSTDGAQVLPFRPSLLSPATDLGLAVHGVRLAYCSGPGDPPPSECVCWWGDMPFLAHALRLMTLSAVHVRVAFAAEAATGTDRKELAEQLWRNVVAAPNAAPQPH
jgi:1-acyl-sn-glycerol-3-phosphate acyltransferase